MASPTHRRSLSCVCLLLGLLTSGAVTSSAIAYRGVPMAMYNVNNQVMNSSSYAYALRFVPDRTTTLYRFFSGFNLEGSDLVGGRPGYAHGTGGTIDARLVTVNTDGTPNLAHVLAEEKVNADTRWQETKTAYAIPAGDELLYVNTSGITVTGGQMYAMVFRNIDANPAANWFSENSPTVNTAYSGPNGANNVDPNAAGAIDNLDPREAVAWSTAGGSTWVWGVKVGAGSTPGSYAGSTTGDDGTRLPWYGWQTASSAVPQSNQPYYAYTMSGAYTLQVKNTTANPISLTRAGGYAPIGGSVGTVTVKNLATASTAHTAPLGTGLAQGALSTAVAVAPGQTYQIANTGTVMLANADSFIRAIFAMNVSWPVQTLLNGPSRADLFALPSGSA